MNFTYVIIEDNPAAIETLKNELSHYPFLINAGEATSYINGKKLIVDQRPSLIFLDVELGDKQGYNLINDIKQFFIKLPKIIMTSAHIQYAREAVNDDYLYFLEKPIDPDELFLAIEKFRNTQISENRILDIKKLDGHYFFRMDEIYYLKSKNNKSIIVKTDLSETEISKTLKELSDLLPSDFLRIHKSYMIHTKFIEKMNISERKILLNVRSGLIELHKKGQELVNLNSGSTFGFDETLMLKNCEIELPIGDLYLENIKDSLLIFNKI